MFIKKLACLALSVMIITSGLTFADDTELYVFESSTRTGARPKVLIIFDNSGSMATIENSAVGGYDSNQIYPAVGSSHSYQGRMVYFTKGSGIDNTSLPTPDSPSESRRFLDNINGCHVSKEALDKYGRFTGYIREYATKGQTGTWEEVPDNNGANISIIDCWEDIEAKDPINATNVNNGFPVDAIKQNKTPIPYNYVNSSSDSAWDKALSDAKNTKFGTGLPVTLYTDNYLRWYTLVQRGELPVVPQSRLDIAKDAIVNIVNSTPTVDFGLAVFNLNYPTEGARDGGRIVSGIKQMTSAAKSSLLSTIEKLPADTNTPLCETLFEAHQYLSGGIITYGHKDSNYNFSAGNKYTANIPPYDISVESGGKYISPFKVCSDIAYIIYITDGTPTVDSNANSAIKTLTAAGSSIGDYSSFSEGLDKNNSPSYLPALASYMFSNDMINQVDSTGVNQRQYVRTFTIGFSEGADDAAPLLKETARRGGGKYFAAKDSLELQSALSDALTSILAIDSSFTSPSIASNNFDRTQTFDAAYYAMFLPGKGPRWSGNLKKLKVTSNGVLVDSNGISAISDNGNIKDSACTYWTNCTSGGDGNKVESGGAASKLKLTSSRKIISNLSSGLEALTVSNITRMTNNSSDDLAAYLRTDEIEINNTVDWLYGYDVDDENKDGNKTDKRPDIMGDPLHSKPLALNFGTTSSPNIRILLGTNQGLMHMFADTGNSVSEPWAFIPYELLPNIAALRANVSNGGHYVYGMDASPVAYTETNTNGEINKAWVFMGMRRGGASYYALDITSPDNPSLMWRISPDSEGFEDLGQTWSDPVVTKIPGHKGPVLIFGGGYDISYDSTPTVNPLGRAIYIVDAQTGGLIHSFGASSTNKTVISGMQDSIPNSVAILDSDNDGLTDRVYATDTGGNVWRFDLPSENVSSWTGFLFASLGGDDSSDRRFFAEPTVAQTVFTNISQVSVTSESGATSTVKTYQNVPYDAVVIGSGNRPHPSGTATSDMFFTLQDRNVVTRSFDGQNNAIPETIQISNLYDVTSAAPVSESENIAFGKKMGWYYDFTETGEKSLTAALIVDGKVYFTSYVPPANSINANVCAASGKGRLYVFDLHKGTRSYSNIFYDLGERVPDTPQIVIPAPETGEPPYVYIIGVGKGEVNDKGEPSGTIKVASGLGVNKIYYHINE
ncbi:pilus assembly protein [Shewanella xiamenensis]|uniref:pilus assembly protein n=1 Tax=Shewanella xiamenensis TaxID=332186 RepID=UPI00002BF760|nr:PilC/PilY family type IV pilus protein [Shewanella xiamenensis]MDV5245800.1 PilC/PilY family type IV pilus protein [Shewanella xiamenensis]PWH02178.1 rRNA (guanine-N1)-methyltransferase [Shewanella xiamenensis]